MGNQVMGTALMRAARESDTCCRYGGEELQQTQLALVQARARYFDLYDLAPIGYCTLNAKGLVTEANQTVASSPARRAVGRTLGFRDCQAAPFLALSLFLRYRGVKDVVQ